MAQFDDLVDDVKVNEVDTLKQNVYATEEISPDQEAETVRLANKFKTNPAFVRPNVEEFKKKSAVPDIGFDSLVENNPRLSGWLSENVSNTALAKDDLGALKNIEDTVNEHGFLAKSYKALNSGAASALSGILKFPKLAYDVAAKPINPLLEKAGYAPLKAEDYFKDGLLEKGINLFDQIAELEANNIPELRASIIDSAKEGKIPEAGKAVYYSILQSAPNTMTAIISTLAGNPAYGLGSIFASASGSKYQENLAAMKQREEDIAKQSQEQLSLGGEIKAPSMPAISENEAILGAVASGSIEVLTEQMFGAFNGLKKSIKPMVNILTKEAGVETTKQVLKQAFKTMVSSAGEEGFEEVVASGANDFADWALDINPDALEMKGFFKRMIEAGVVGAGSGGLLTSPAAIGIAYQQKRALKQAQLNRDTLLAIGPKFNDSKLKERLPEKHREYVEKVTKGTALENVYIPLTKFDAYFQSKNQDAAQAAAEMGISKMYDEAKVTGDLVQVPIGNWAERVVGTEVERGLINDTKFNRDELTVNEAQAEREKSTEALKEVVAKEEQAKAVEAQTREIQKDLQDKLVASGAYNATDARAMAQTLAQPYRTRAESLGMTPQELYKKEGLKVFGYDVLPESVQGFEQGENYYPVDTGELLDGEPTDLWEIDLGGLDIDASATAQLLGPDNYPNQLSADGDEARGQKLAEKYNFNNVLEIRTIEVGASFQSKGIATKLLKSLLAEANKKGIDAIILNASPMGDEGLNLKELVAFYKKNGFKVIDKTENNQTMLFDMTSKKAKAYFQEETNAQQAPTFYYKSQQLLNDKMGNTASVEQVKAILKEVKSEELKWLGVDSFLKGKEKVSKAELLDYLRANELQIEEVVKGVGKENNAPYVQIVTPIEDGWKVTFSDGQSVGVRKERNIQTPEAAEAHAIDSRSIDVMGFEGDEQKFSGAPKFSNYQLPSGENYREVLFRMPKAPQSVDVGDISTWEAEPYKQGIEYTKEINGKTYRVIFNKNLKKWSALQPVASGFKENLQEVLDAVSAKATGLDEYKSSHWNESNVLAHTRLNDRVDADGKKVLFVEEIQSDWHQEGRKKGYKGDSVDTVQRRSVNEINDERVAYTNQLIDKYTNNLTPEQQEAEIEKYGWVGEDAVKQFFTPEENQKRDDLLKELRDSVSYENNKTKGVPDAPFRKTWHEFVMKRLIREAVEKGYDKIAWTTGEQQAERYDLSKQIDSVEVYKKANGNYNLSAYKDKAAAERARNPLIEESNVTPDRLSDLIGKDLAEKITRDVTEIGEPKSYSGIDLKVGGEGMKGFYDKILVDFANKFGKKYGAKVESAEVVVGKADNRDFEIRPLKDGYVIFDTVGEDTVGNTIYKTVKNANDRLEEIIKELRVDEKSTVHSLPITPELRDAALNQGFALFQADKQKNVRGFFDPVARLVGLIKGKANLSTMLHEGGHVFLEQMSRDFDYLKGLPELNDKQTEYRDRMQTTLEYLGVESFQDIKTEHHEKWARSFEAYLMEGKAPSKRLQLAFEKFKLWMLDIYKSIKGLDVELTPEIRDVFDRLLATEEEIQKAQKNYTSLMDDPIKAGMDKALANKWYSASSDAVEAASTLVREPVMKDYLKKQQKLYKEEKAKVREELSNGLDKLPDQMALKAIESDPMVKDLPVEMQAEIYGYDSVVDFETQMDQARRQREYIDEAVDAEMQRRYPDSFFDLEESAIEAVHNDKQAERLRIEAEFLASKLSDKQLGARLIARLPNSKILKEEAARRVGEKVVKDIKPYVFERAERAAAKEAAQAFKELQKKGVKQSEELLQKAFEAKRREILNHEMFKASIEAQRQVEKKVKDYKKLFKKNEDLAKYRDIDYVNAARAVAANYGITRADKTAEEYLSKLKQYDPAGYAGLMNLVNTASDNAGPYKDISFNKFNSMTRAVDALWNLSKSTEQQTIDGKKIDRALVVEDLLAQSTSSIKSKASREKYDSTKAKHGKFASFGLKLKGALTRIEAWVDYIDNGKIDGPFRKYIWNPVMQANIQYDLKKQETLSKFRDMLQKHAKDFKKEAIVAKELTNLEGKPFQFESKLELLMAILHRGNNSNFSKLLRGYGWGTEVDGVLDTSKWDAFERRMQKEGVLTKADYDFAQSIWDIMESFKGDLQKAHKELEGYYFEEVTSTEFTNEFGTYRGGYIPAKVDTKNVKDFKKLEEIEIFEKNNPSMAFPTTGSGATKTRNEAFARRLSLDLNLLGAHMDWALRYTYFEPRVREVSRLINDETMKTELERIDPEIKGTLEAWLQRTAQQTVVTPSNNALIRAIDPASRYFRTSAAMQVMFGNVTNTIQQYTGLVVAMAKVKPRNIVYGFAQYLNGYTIKDGSIQNKMVEEMVAKSEYMNTIQGINVYETQNAITEIIATPNKFEKVQDFAMKHTYILQSAAQNVVNTSVWWGAYNQGVTGGMTEAQAIQSADSAVRLTQGTNKAIDLASFEVGSPTYRMFIQFAGYFNMLANLNAGEAGKIINDVGIRKGGGRLFYLYLTGFMLPAFMSEVLVQLMGGKGFDADDDDEYLDDMLALFAGAQFKTATAMVPILGNFAVAKYNRAFTDSFYDDRLNMSLAITTYDKITDFPVELYKDIQGDSVKLGKTTKDFMSFIGTLSKTPAGALGKQTKYLIDVSEGEIEPKGVIDFTRGVITGKGERR